MACSTRTGRGGGTPDPALLTHAARRLDAAGVAGFGASAWLPRAKESKYREARRASDRCGIKALATHPEIGRPVAEMPPEFREWFHPVRRRWLSHALSLRRRFNRDSGRTARQGGRLFRPELVNTAGQMRRRDFTLGLQMASAVGAVRAQEPTTQHRIAVIATPPVARIDDPTIPRLSRHFSKRRRLGDVEGRSLQF